MGLGSETPRNKMYYLNLRTKRDKVVDPHFTVECKEGDEMKKLPDEKEISGWFKKISHGEYEWTPPGQNNPKKEKTISIHLVDGGREFKVEMNIASSLARNVMNNLCSVRSVGWMVIRVYMNKEDYPSIYMTSDNEAIKWAYQWKDNLEKLVEYVPDYDSQVPDAKKPVYHKLNNYLLNAWIGQEKVLNASAIELEKIRNEQAKQVTAPAAEAGKNVFAEKLAAGAGTSLQDEFNNQAGPGDGPRDDKDSPDNSGSDDLPF